MKSDKPDYKPFTFEQNIVLSNEELISNWTKFASFIRSYEGGEWDDAREKATGLLKTGQAIAYIEEIRRNVAVAEGKIEPPVSTGPTAKPSAAKSSPFNDPMYSDNFQRLLELAPGIVERLHDIDFKTQTLFGKSERTGYRDLVLEVVGKEQNDYYLTLTQFDGKLKPKPSMILRLDLKKEIVEALEFADPTYSKRVYSVDNERKFIDLEEQERQNEFLSDWLKKLADEKHSIKWKERSPHGVESLIINQHKKAEQEKDQKPAKAEKPVEEKQKQPSMSDADKKTIAKAVQLIEGVDQNQADITTQVLIDHNTVFKYLLSGIDKLWKKQRDALLSFNRAKLLHLVPDILHKLTDSSVTVRLKASERLPIYDFAYGEDKTGLVRKFAVYESTKESNEGTLIIVVRPGKAYIEHLSGNFFDHEDYYDLTTPPTAVEVEAMRDFFSKWLDFLSSNGYRAEWSEVDENKVVAPTTPVSKEEEDSDDEHYINEGIPDFEIGQVKLVEAHVKHGITQEIIDQINRTGEGVTLRPRKGSMVFNTKNALLDASIQAKPPGLRLSAHGKFYNEGRSNRADRTRNQGL